MIVNVSSGRKCVLNFVNIIKSDVTKKIYEYDLRLFMEFCGIHNLQDSIGHQNQIIPYLMSLREKNYLTIVFQQS
jgi:hypothetical protein